MSPQEPATGRQGRGRGRSRLVLPLGLALLVALALASFAAWLAADESPFLDTDSYSYLARLLELTDRLPEIETGEDAAEALAALSHAGRPPLYQILTVPLVWIGGRSEEASLAVNGLFLILMMVATALATRRLVGGRGLLADGAALLGALLVACYPPLVHLAHSYRAHYAVPAALALSLWLALRLVDLADRSTPDRDRPGEEPTKRTGPSAVRAAWALGLSAAFGLLLHPSYAWAAAGPILAAGLLVLGRLVRRRGLAAFREPVVLRGLLPAAVLALAPAALWYLTVGRSLFGLLQDLSSNEIAAFRGYQVRAVGFAEVEPGLGWILRTSPGALSWPLLLALGLGLLGLLGALFRVLRPPADGHDALPGALLVLVTLASGYGLIGAQTSLAWMYAAPLLPTAAVATAGGLALLLSRRSLEGRPLRALPQLVFPAVAALVAAFALWAHGITAWGLGVDEGAADRGRLAEALGARLQSQPHCRLVRSFCPAPPRREEWPAAEILARVFEDPACRAGKPACRLMVVYTAGLSNAMLDYVRIRDWPDSRLFLHSHGDAAWGLPYPLPNLLESHYLLNVSGLQSAPGQESSDYRLATSRFLDEPPKAFADTHRPVASWTLPTGHRAVLIARTAPLTRREVNVSTVLLPLEERFKTRRQEVLDRLPPPGPAPPAPPISPAAPGPAGAP